MSAISINAMQRAIAVGLASLLWACGGGGSSAPAESTTPTASQSVTYAQSVVAGMSAPQSIVYVAASGSGQAALVTTVASPLLPIGVTPVLVEHVEPNLPGLRVACVSGRGESTNIVVNINLGVIAQSAAVLLDDRWKPIDSVSAWSAAVASGGAWLGWENCGVKPEGLPSPSSRLVPAAGGGYAEDVFDGNPGTTFQTIRRNVSVGDVTSMLAPDGLLTLEDPQRPLRLLLRAYQDAAGHVVFIESGTPVVGAVSSARGFVALYVPGA